MGQALPALVSFAIIAEGPSAWSRRFAPRPSYAILLVVSAGFAFIGALPMHTLIAIR
jgi:hypothetical protein